MERGASRRRKSLEFVGVFARLLYRAVVFSRDSIRQDDLTKPVLP